MKSIVSKFLIAAFALAGAEGFVPEAKAADLTLDGFGYYERDSRVRYFNRKKAPKQSGRYRSFGADYYRKAEIGIDYLSNNSRSRSGDISFEFWAMPYYGATKGIVLMTQGLKPLKGDRYYDGLDVDGYATDLDQRRFPELNVWEYTRSGWRFRDALSFDYRRWL